ncbi:MAG: phosphatase PAP2 family protein [Tenericutes bacterium]|nr:phosphatase PAP2 family protein [Mycoplasmatota bacterium]
MAVKLFKENFVSLLSIIILIIVFYIIKNTAIYESIISFDNSVIKYINSITNENRTLFFKIFTFIGDMYVPLAIIIFLFIFVQNKLRPFALSINYVFYALLAFIIKSIVMRPRPVESLILAPNSSSFPSGHTLTSIGFYLVLWYILFSKNKNKVVYLILFIILIILIGFSRIYLGVHYFSDVFGALLISIPCLFISKNIINKLIKEI